MVCKLAEKTAGKQRKKEPVEHKEIWEQLISYLDVHKISFYRVKGHVNLNSKVTDFDKLYNKFVEWNGPSFSYEDFEYITKMNNRADELANLGIDEAGGNRVILPASIQPLRLCAYPLRY